MFHCVVQLFSIQNKSTFLFADIELRDRDININSAIVKRETTNATRTIATRIKQLNR